MTSWPRLLLAYLLLVGLLASPAFAAPCDSLAPMLWQIHQQVATGTDLAPRDLDLPQDCEDGISGTLDLRLLTGRLKVWSSNTKLSTNLERLQLLDQIDLVLARLLAADLPEQSAVRSEFVRELNRLEQLMFLVRGQSFPLSPSDTILLGEAMAAPGDFSSRLFASWRSLDVESQRQVQESLQLLLQSMLKLEPKDQPATLRPRIIFWLRENPAPMPAGEDNTRFYINLVIAIATYDGQLQQLRAQVDQRLGATPAALPDADLQALQHTVDPRAFREPLQIAPITQPRPPNWLSRLLERFISGLGTAAGSLDSTLHLIAVLIAGGLFGWLLYLLAGGTLWGSDRRVGMYLTGSGHVLAGRHLSPAEQFRLALEAARLGRYLESWHWLTQGFILGLAQGQLIPLDWSRTNREVLRDLQRQRATVLEPASRFFRTAERVVYGGHPTTLAEIQSYERELTAALATLPQRK